MAKLKKRPDGRYQTQFVFEGKRYSVYASTARDLQQKKLERLQQLAENSNSRINPTLEDYYKSFTELRRNKVKESTIRCQRSWFQNCADVVINDNGKKLREFRIRDITPKDCQKVQQELMKKDYSSRTVNDCMKHLSHVFHAAVKDETITRNPCMCIEHLRQTEQPARETKHRALSKNETESFFKAAARSAYLTYFQMMIQTGLRIGELCALLPSDIDTDCIHISKTITRDEVGGYMIGDSTKTYSGTRDIPLNNTIRKIISDQKVLKRSLPFCRLLFCSLEGKILREYTVNREIRKICKSINIEPFTCHAFRATFATRWIEQRPHDYKILSEILGHANIKITLDLYTHVMKENKEEAMKGINIAM